MCAHDTPSHFAVACALLVLCSQSDVTMRLARVKPAVRAVLEREGTLERLGAARIHGNVHRAVEAQLSA